MGGRLVVSVEGTPTPGGSPPPLEGQVITFPQGLIGCDNWRRFTLDSDPNGGGILLLTCLDQPGIAFWVTDPFLIVSDYEVQISDGEALSIELQDLSDALVLCILTVRPQPAGVTANLMGPLVINLRGHLGRQLVLSDSRYTVRHPIVPTLEGDPSGASQQ